MTHTITPNNANKTEAHKQLNNSIEFDKFNDVQFFPSSSAHLYYNIKPVAAINPFRLNSL